MASNGRHGFYLELVNEPAGPPAQPHQLAAVATPAPTWCSTMAGWTLSRGIFKVSPPSSSPWRGLGSPVRSVCVGGCSAAVGLGCVWSAGRCPRPSCCRSSGAWSLPRCASGLLRLDDPGRDFKMRRGFALRRPSRARGLRKLELPTTKTILRSVSAFSSGGLVSAVPHPRCEVLAGARLWDAGVVSHALTLLCSKGNVLQPYARVPLVQEEGRATNGKNNSSFGEC